MLIVLHHFVLFKYIYKNYKKAIFSRTILIQILLGGGGMGCIQKQVEFILAESDRIALSGRLAGEK